jgi:hypothetical protein
MIFHFNEGPLSFNYEDFDGNLPTFLLNPYSWTKVRHHHTLLSVLSIKIYFDVNTCVFTLNLFYQTINGDVYIHV